VDRMHNAAERMRRLINDLLSYSRVTTNAKPFQWISLKELLEDVRSDLQIRIEENTATIEVGELPSVQGDPTQMRQLVQNLISNALKFRKPDVAPVIKLNSHVQAAQADSTAGPNIVLTIEDNGIGFENQFNEQIFTIFQRLHSRNEYEGTGIGLATCRKIVERHGGTISADGCPGEGSKFTITIPQSQVTKEQAA
jgi:signal transduction histidine kinase